jgi:uridine kinase
VTECSIAEWREEFTRAFPDTTFVIADGFVLYYDPECCTQFDVKLFVREAYDVLKERRHERNGYVRLESILESLTSPFTHQHSTLLVTIASDFVISRIAH